MDGTLKVGDLKRTSQNDYLEIISWLELNHRERTMGRAFSWAINSGGQVITTRLQEEVNGA